LSLVNLVMVKVLYGSLMSI